MNIGRVKIESVNELAEITGFDVHFLENIISHKPNFYRSFPIPKDDGTTREITPPVPVLRLIQRRLKAFVERNAVWTNAVHGGIRDKSIITNAVPHVRRFMVANLDISGFFPHTTASMVSVALKRFGCSSEVSAFVAELVTYRNQLPQGSPTSMIMGNLVLEPMDSGFMKLCRRHRLTYTRYVDDLTISGDTSLHAFRGAFIGLIEKAGFSVSPTKIHFRGRDERQVVTGIVVNDVARPHSDFLRELRQAIRLCWPENIGPEIIALDHGKTVPELKAMLFGRIRFVQSVDKKVGHKIRALMTKVKWFSDNGVSVDGETRSLLAV